ncbi:stage III sporulation protein AF [Cohnella sp. GCM10027633]|uniref:stage III sporulation protein AF n=1 Tax=unclassified Cohnella TaxID=2636738 RepID=UPI003633C8F0
MGLMDGLSGWLRQIIAVLLLASLIDLLLPNRTMQRYVRLVAGLFILLTVATPVLGWMKGDFGDKLAEGLSSVERSPQGAPEQLAMIEAEGARLRANLTDQAANLAAARLASAIRSDVEASENRAVRSVDVRSARDKDGGWTVTGVKVVFEQTDAEASRSAGAIASVKEVEPIAAVDIQVEVGGERSGADGGGNDLPAQEAVAEASVVDEALESRVVSLVSARYGIGRGLIEVKEAPVGANGTRR